jgi:hypothetical protein
MNKYAVIVAGAGQQDEQQCAQAIYFGHKDKPVLLYISPCFLDAYTEIYTVLP